MRVMPAPLLQRMIDVLMRGMRRSHPGLFRNLERLDAAIIRINPSDLPHQFILTIGQGQTSLTLADAECPPHRACVQGKLRALLDLLEGRIDSDMLFFSREIEITGDTSVVVGLRNTIDREDIDLLKDITALCGPFAHPARRAVSLMNVAAEKIKNRLAALYEERHPDVAKARDAQNECDRLRAEVQALKTRLAKFEVRRKKTEAATS